MQVPLIWNGGHFLRNGGLSSTSPEMVGITYGMETEVAPLQVTLVWNGGNDLRNGSWRGSFARYPCLGWWEWLTKWKLERFFCKLSSSGIARASERGTEETGSSQVTAFVLANEQLKGATSASAGMGS